MSGSVVEIDTQVVDGRVYFHKFFCALKPCVDGFLEGCRPYLSIDSTALNGRWNGHLAVATGVDGNNWMYPVAFGFFDSETKAMEIIGCIPWLSNSHLFLQYVQMIVKVW